jgi:hypothetical protein
MKRPCGNCPFRREGAIELAPGRLASIIEEIVGDDYATFVCHKTVDYGDERHCGEAGGHPIDEASEQCAGATLYLMKAQRWNVRMRLGQHLGVFDPERLAPYLDEVIDPPIEDTTKSG